MAPDGDHIGRLGRGAHCRRPLDGAQRVPHRAGQESGSHHLPDELGRNFDEVLHGIDSLQLTATEHVATPVNWEQGEDVIILPSASNEAAAEKYPEG